jgi:hypothetical protein
MGEQYHKKDDDSNFLILMFLLAFLRKQFKIAPFRAYLVQYSQREYTKRKVFSSVKPFWVHLHRVGSALRSCAKLYYKLCNFSESFIDTRVRNNTCCTSSDDVHLRFTSSSLELNRVANSEFVSTFSSSILDNLSASYCSHSSQETVYTESFSFFEFS